jgi:hypothetical protein
LDFLLHHETSWSLWCGTQWNLLVLLLIPWSLLYLPAACSLCLKLNSCSCCSSSALFQSTVSGCKHQKKPQVQEDNNSFWLWVAKRKPKGENFTEPCTPKRKAYLKNCNCCGSLRQELILPWRIRRYIILSACVLQIHTKFKCEFASLKGERKSSNFVYHLKKTLKSFSLESMVFLTCKWSSWGSNSSIQ